MFALGGRRGSALLFRTAVRPARFIGRSPPAPRPAPHYQGRSPFVGVAPHWGKLSGNTQPPASSPRGPFPAGETPEHSALAAGGPAAPAFLRPLWEPWGPPAEPEAPWACGVRIWEPCGPPGHPCVPRSWAGDGPCPVFTSLPPCSRHWPLGSLKPHCAGAGV